MIYKARRETVEAEVVQAFGAKYYAVEGGGRIEMIPAAMFALFYEPIVALAPTVGKQLAASSLPVRVRPVNKRPASGEPSLTDKLVAALEYGPLTTAELAERLYAEEPNVKKRIDCTYQIVNKAKAAGLVERREDPSAGGIAKWYKSA